MIADPERLIERVREALATAHYNLQGGWTRAAVNRAYYAAFYAASAAVRAEGESPATHSGVLNRFAFHFVVTGRIARDVANIYPIALEMRQDADYDLDDPPPPDVVEDMLAQVERFVKAVEALIAR